MTTVIDVGGVDIRSAAILQRDCSFPITNLGRRCKRDQVFAAMPIWLLGRWRQGPGDHGDQLHGGHDEERGECV